jgi:hypothetical protein
MALRDDLRATYERARGQGMDEAMALTLVFNRHLRGTLQTRVTNRGNETIGAVVSEMDVEYRAFAEVAGLPLEFFADALRDNYPSIYAHWQE